MFGFLFILSLLLSLLVGLESSIILEFSFYSFFHNDLFFSFIFDYVSLLFFSFISLISSVVFFYSKFYFNHTPKVVNYLTDRYSYLLSLFVFSMFFLVFSGSFIVVMIGWDGLGLVSFLLVIYYNNSEGLSSGLITLLTNRLGDCLFILSFLMMFGGGWFFLDFFSFSYFVGFSFLLSLGCITKSAQFPFSAWLPMAMAAPTPVSSLVHSSTLVTAGVYLLIRFNFLLEGVSFIIIPLSLITLVAGGLAALFEVDLKKVVAMSTLSQLGFMVFSVSTGHWCLGFFHMIFHAFFKSSMFLSSGNLMHYLGGSQDSRLFGSLGSSFFSKLIFCCSCLSLSGFPFSLGFYSKDLIMGFTIFNSFSFSSFFFLLGCCFTVSYTARLISLCFLGFPLFHPSVEFKDDLFFYFPVVLLFLISSFSGNYFLFSFFPPVIFSFLDFFVGVVIIFFGLFIFSLSLSNYPLFSVFMSVFFLFEVTPRLSFISLFPFQVSEATWGEMSGGSGYSLLVCYLQSLMKPYFYFVSYFSSFVVIFSLLLTFCDSFVITYL